MIDSPEDVMKKVSEIADINIQRQLWVHFIPERINYYCISSMDFEFDKVNNLKLVHIFNPLNDWIENP
jgi:hypothetical protein